MTKEECKIVIQNANDVLNSPILYDSFSKYGSFYTDELNSI